MVTAIVDGMCRLFSLLMVACLAAMVAMVFGNVVLRYGFNSGITMSEELSRWLFVWMTFLGSFVAVRQRRHLGTNVVTKRLPLVGQKLCFAAARVLMLAACGAVALGGWRQLVLNRNTTSAVMEASLAIFYAAVVLFAALAAVVLLLELVQLAQGRLSSEDLMGVADEEPLPDTDAHESRA